MVISRSQPDAWLEEIEGCRGRGLTGVAGPDQTYSEYAAAATAEICPNEDVCATKYYENVLRQYSQISDANCWPEFRFSYSEGPAVTAFAWAGMGGVTRPLERRAFMESFQNGNETYMRSFDTIVTDAIGDDGSVECNMRVEFLLALDAVSIITPDGSGPPEDSIGVPGANMAKAITPGTDPTLLIPDVGVASTVRSVFNTTITSVLGTDEATSLCQAQLGESNERTRNGFVSKGAIVADTNPIPSP